MDPVQKLWQQIHDRKVGQNERRAKQGKPPKWKGLAKEKKPVTKRARASRAVVPPAPESGLEHDTAMSFEEWKDCGWSIKKGEKSDHMGLDRKPQFLRSQVQKSNPAWEQWRKKQ